MVIDCIIGLDRILFTQECLNARAPAARAFNILNKLKENAI